MIVLFINECIVSGNFEKDSDLKSFVFFFITLTAFNNIVQHLVK